MLRGGRGWSLVCGYGVVPSSWLSGPSVVPCFWLLTVEQPGHLGQVPHVLAIRQKETPAPQLDHLTGDEVKTLLAEPGTASAPAVRDTVLLALSYNTAACVQVAWGYRNTADKDPGARS
jgi:hypothetical protein